MTMILAFDTETSDLVRKELPASHAAQPHVVQLAAILADESTGDEVASFSMIVRPEGWKVAAGAANAHGITTERAEELGVPILVPLACFSNLAKKATRHVAHNVEYDVKALGAAFHRAARPMPPVDAACTMRLSTAHVNLPPTDRMLAAGYDKPKPPTLTQLHEHLFGVGFDGAHDALADARACLRCWFELKKRGVVT